MSTNQWVDKKVQVELEPHVDAFLLADYADGLLDEEQEREVRGHLVDCQACADEFLALTAPLGFVPKPSDPPLKANSWESLVAIADRGETTETEPAQAERQWQPALVLPWLATAAALLLAAWLWLDRPAPSVHTTTAELTLLPVDEATRGNEAMGDGDALLVLRLSFTEPTTVNVFEIAVFPKGEVAPHWSSTLNRQTDGTFLVSFEPGYFSPGQYQVELKGGGELLAAYEFSIGKP